MANDTSVPTCACEADRGRRYARQDSVKHIAEDGRVFWACVFCAGWVAWEVR